MITVLPLVSLPGVEGRAVWHFGSDFEKLFVCELYILLLAGGLLGIFYHTLPINYYYWFVANNPRIMSRREQ